MFEFASPESMGIKSEWIENFIRHLEDKGITMHDVLIMKGDKIVFEAYWKPFHKDFLHRQYSQTKSFVGIAIGLLAEEGKLRLDDKIADYFRDKIDGELHEYMENQTIRDMLTMTTCCLSSSWFDTENCDRVHMYFNDSKILYPSGTVWRYDSPGSQVLSVLVERLSGMTLLEYLKEKIFNKIGSFKNAKILKTPTGDSWGDSAMICTARDMLSFGKFLMNYGEWNGERLMNSDYVKEATSPLVYNNDTGQIDRKHDYGYGYQIWCVREDTFAFVGMGQQLTLCNRDKDLILVCNSDTQGAYYPYDTLINYYFDEILNRTASSPLPENPEANARLEAYKNTLKLRALQGKKDSSTKDRINGKKFNVVEKNSMGITEFRFEFEGDSGVLYYTNAQGDKKLKFKFLENEFTKFEELGYSKEVGGVRTSDGHMYNVAVSAAWKDDTRLQIYVQAIDEYFGILTLNFAFKGDYAGVTMTKKAEDFFNTYEGTLAAKMA